jgi:Cu(I)/Ag(I) efflux system membrane protein CusA/SilA
LGWHWAGLAAAVYGAYSLIELKLSARGRTIVGWTASLAVMAFVLVVLTGHWMPLGPGAGFMRNLAIVLGINLAWAAVRVVFIDFYPYFLRLFLAHKLAFLSIPTGVVVFGLVVWLGFGRVAGAILPRPSEPDAQAPGQFADGKEPAGLHGDAATRDKVRGPEPGIYQKLWVAGLHKFPGLGREFMPPLDEGSFLFMPSMMPHAGIGPSLDAISAQDKAIRAIPEVESVVGKLGRAETAIDPAPISMIETVVLYKTEYQRDLETGELVLDEQGAPIRQWRDHIKSPNDIWKEILKAGEFPGATGAPKLQPIAARLVMLQSGMRAPMGVKVYGNSLEDIEKAGYEIAEVLKTIPSVAADAVIPDRVVGKPYLEIDIDRQRMDRYGVTIRDVQDVIEIALGGIRASTTVVGRER